jgi:hypothetical protein
MTGDSDEFVERYRPKIIATIFTAEYTGDFETVLSSLSCVLTIDITCSGVIEPLDY